MPTTNRPRRKARPAWVPPAQPAPRAPLLDENGVPVPMAPNANPAGAVATASVWRRHPVTGREFNAAIGSFANPTLARVWAEHNANPTDRVTIHAANADTSHRLVLWARRLPGGKWQRPDAMGVWKDQT